MLSVKMQAQTMLLRFKCLPQKIISFKWLKALCVDVGKGLKNLEKGKNGNESDYIHSLSSINVCCFFLVGGSENIMLQIYTPY